MAITSSVWQILKSTISNVNSSNNKFYFDKDDKEIVPEGSYEPHDINKYLKRAISNDITRKKTLRKN